MCLDDIPDNPKPAVVAARRCALDEEIFARSCVAAVLCFLLMYRSFVLALLSTSLFSGCAKASSPKTSQDSYDDAKQVNPTTVAGAEADRLADADASTRPEKPEADARREDNGSPPKTNTCSSDSHCEIACLEPLDCCESVCPCDKALHKVKAERLLGQRQEVCAQVETNCPKLKCAKKSVKHRAVCRERRCVAVPNPS